METLGYIFCVLLGLSAVIGTGLLVTEVFDIRDSARRTDSRLCELWDRIIKLERAAKKNDA